jgi:histidinol-phosphate aminotransferase
VTFGKENTAARDMGTAVSISMKAWESNVRKIVPYVPGEQPNHKHMVKLNTNENPFPPAPGVDRVLKEINSDSFRLYPDPTVKLLAASLADYYNLNQEQVFVGVGSDDVLAVAFMTFFNSEKPILFPDITYSFYPVWCDLFRIPYKNPALDEKFRIKKEDYLQENGGIVIANPNAPTSIYEDLSVIEEIIKKNPGTVVIIDEAYIDFAGKSAVELVAKYDNLLVVQTFSKARSLAGMRIGYAMGQPELIKAMNDVKYSYNSYTMNQTAIECGVEAVRDVKYFKEGIQKIIDIRKNSEEGLRKLGFSFPESGANFLFVTHEKIPAKEIFESLRSNHIYVRYFNLPRINNFLRITIGTQEDMDRLLTFLENYINTYDN